MSGTDGYKKIAAKYLNEKEYFEEVHRIARTEADGYWKCLEDRTKERDELIKQRNDLLAACDRLEKGLSDNPADYSDMDWFEQVQCNRGKARAAIAKSKK